ncbi:unnamed protein product, partial [Polarella glacialis]
VLPYFVSDEEAKALLAAVDANAWDTTIKRRVQHYGHAFDYARLTIAEGGDVPELPSFCAGVVRRIAESGLMPEQVNQLTINEYEPGVGIALHVDTHSAFEDGIAAVTLGSGLVMEFRRPQLIGAACSSAGSPPAEASQKNVWLPPNSLLVMSGEARYAWQHGIAWRKTDCLEEGEVLPRSRRVSLTFRRARGRPCDCRWPSMCDGQNPETLVLPSRLGPNSATESSAPEGN